MLPGMALLPALARKAACSLRLSLRPIGLSALVLAIPVLAPALPAAATAQEPGRLAPVTTADPRGLRLVEQLRGGGHVLFFRHADTVGMPCDRSYRIGDRDGQRNLSARGREQSRRIGKAIEELEIPISLPVLAGPVFRARDTAELAFGAGNVTITNGLLADDYAGGRLQEVLDGHRKLFSGLVPARINRVLVGHRTPAIMVLGDKVGGRAFPEGAALVIVPGGGGPPRVSGILMLAPVEGDGFHAC